MRQGQQNRRNRGRGRSRSNNPLSRNYESNGPDVKIKGTAAHIADKYTLLARDALSSGNTVTAENYYQHAEHYFRIIQNAQAKQEEHAASQTSKAPRNDRRPKPQSASRPQRDSVQADVGDIPGSGEQPRMNGTSAEEKPKRKARPRKPKAAKTQAGEGAASKEDGSSNIVAS